jgi:hypothetical protein
VVHRGVSSANRRPLAILLAKRTAWKKAQPVTQDAAWTMYSMRGRAGAEGLGRVFGTSLCGKGGSAPHFTVAHHLRGFQCSLQRANGPVGRINAERPDGPPADDAA